MWKTIVQKMWNVKVPPLRSLLSMVMKMIQALQLNLTKSSLWQGLLVAFLLDFPLVTSWSWRGMVGWSRLSGGGHLGGEGDAETIDHFMKTLSFEIKMLFVFVLQDSTLCCCFVTLFLLCHYVVVFYMCILVEKFVILCLGQLGCIV